MCAYCTILPIDLSIKMCATSSAHNIYIYIHVTHLHSALSLAESRQLGIIVRICLQEYRCVTCIYARDQPPDVAGVILREPAG